MLSGNYFSTSSTSSRPLDDNRSNMLSMMHVKASRLMNLQSLLYHAVWSTSPFGGMRDPVDQTSRYERLGNFISLGALVSIVDNMLEQLSSRDREDVEEEEKKLPLNMGYKKITSSKTRKCTSRNLKN